MEVRYGLLFGVTVYEPYRCQFVTCTVILVGYLHSHWKSRAIFGELQLQQPLALWSCT